MTGGERKIWDALVRHAKYRLSIYSIDLIVIEDDIQSLIAMDSHVRELEAKLCRAREALELEGVPNSLRVDNRLSDALREIREALSSTGPCRHEKDEERIADTEGLAREIYKSKNPNGKWSSAQSLTVRQYIIHAEAVQRFLRGEE